MISRKPKLQRQRKIFKQQGKNFPRANQMNINVATWGRLLKRSSPSIQDNHTQPSSESPPSGMNICRQDVWNCLLSGHVDRPPSEYLNTHNCVFYINGIIAKILTTCCCYSELCL